jgi:tetratricopeptide (TPR) repeat protein
MREKAGALKLVAAGLGGSAVLLAWAITLSWVSPAFAHPTSIALADRYARGEYLEAASLAEAAAGADDLAFAARALLAHCMTGSAAPDASLVERAVKDAEAALRLDPAHEEGRLQLAIALSLKSRDMDLMAAWSAGYGEKGKKLAEEVLKADPANFYAHGFLAVWNLEVARRGGGMGAWMLGASTESGRKHYEQARALAPDDVGVHWQYARALAALDLKGKTPEVRAALQRALAAAASDHVELVMQARAQQLSDALAGDRDAAQRLAQAML